MRLRRIAALLVALTVSSASAVLAQVTTTGSIQLIIEDAQGGRLPGVTVTASAVDVVTSRTAVSDAEGVATLDALMPSAAYIVKASLAGFRDMQREAILVRSGQVTTLRVELVLTTMTESVTVTGQTSPLVDVTRAVSGQDITLRLTESLPTARSYQDYLQLVPGVMPDSTVSGGNPASRSGVNFKENSATADNIGASTDNVYYFDAINVTDPVTGTFGANLNTEIIQEQKVITGGIPAEYVGASGLISTVITKSGSNVYSGSYNYFFRNQGFFAENINNPGGAFTTKDTAFTIGGPVIKNALWGYGSYRYLNTTRDVNAADTRAFLRSSEQIGKQGFAKATYAPGQNDMIMFTFLNDPTKRSSDNDPSVVNSRIRRREQGGNRYTGNYNRVWSSILIDGGISFHDAALSDFAVDRTERNTVAFQTSDVRSLTDEQRGGFGQDFPETRPTWQARGSAQYQWRNHTFKGGMEWTQKEDHRFLTYTGDTKAQYTSISDRYLQSGGVLAGSIGTSAVAWSTRQFRTDTASDFNGLITAINNAPNRASFYSTYDTNSDGTISAAELNNTLRFNSTVGNPHGQINYFRIIQTAEGAQDQKVVGVSFFAQDQISLNRWTFNAGLRGERWGHYSTTNAKVFQFPMVFAPRLSAVYDILGDGRHKATAYWGRYYDPIRMDMTNFAGTATGQVREEQVFINNQWLSYRVRGGPTIDGLFAPATKTPYTDELQFQYEADLGNNLSASAVYYNRKTRAIFEDFDPSVYANPATYAGDINNPGTLYLGYEFFGFDPNNLPPRANFYLATLPDAAERNYNGLEFTLRKRFSNRYQILSSYSYLDATGNTISDGNADFVGDVLWLDPRAPNMNGVLPGTIKHNFKAAGSYTTVFGLELGATYRWNSGAIVNKTQFASSRRLPIQGPAFDFNGTVDNWVPENTIGAVQNPSWGQMDTRIQYVRRMGRATGEAFLDIFNITNNQGAVRIQDLVAGTGGVAFEQPFQWLNPRNAFIGFRVRF